MFTAVIHDDGYFGDSIGIHPNFTKTVQEVFIQAIVSYSKRHDDLDFLLFLGSAGSVADLPSWVPDWSEISVSSRGGFVLECSF